MTTHHPAEEAQPWVGASAWLPKVYLGFAAALLPWSGYLAVSLPERSVSPHYATTWVGFDLLLMAVLARIGWLSHRRNPRVVLAAAVGATLLVADAWFDITTAASGTARTQAILSAVLLELPTAGLSVLLARRGLAALIDESPPGSAKLRDLGTAGAAPTGSGTTGTGGPAQR